MLLSKYIKEVSDCVESGGRVLTHASNCPNSFTFTVYTDPWIACPIDRVEDLEPDKSTVVLGYKWQLPRTNMKNVTVSPSNYDENYPFPVGRHRVTWIGTSDSGTQKSCSFYVTVNGRRDNELYLECNSPTLHWRYIDKKSICRPTTACSI